MVIREPVTIPKFSFPRQFDADKPGNVGIHVDGHLMGASPLGVAVRVAEAANSFPGIVATVVFPILVRKGRSAERTATEARSSCRPCTWRRAALRPR
jgi:hypothetical protein